jgi:hypothetical protein
MMESPSKYSVEQLLKARQDGVPDYIVVPMIQKAMAEKQASQNQQAMQQGAQKPPTVAQQVLSSAAQTMNKEKQLEGMPDIPTEDVSVTPRGMGKHPMADVQEEMGEEPEQMATGGIASLRSGLPSEYAHGGIIAFAKGEEVPSPEEEDAVELPAIVNRHKNIFGQSKNDVPKDYPDVPANVADARRLIDEAYSQFDNPDDFVTKWRGKGASDLPTYKKNAHEFLKKTGWKEGDKLNLKDAKDVNRMMSVIAQQEMGAHVAPDKWDAVAAGKYKLGEGVPAAKAKEAAPQGIASLMQPKEASPLDLSELEKLKSSNEDRDLATQMAKGESLYGTNPDYERRAKAYDEQEAKLKGDDDKAMWKALMHAGIGMMSGKSPNFMSNLASGVTAGAEDYEKTQEDIEAKKARLAQLRDALGDARRQERLAVAKYGADSVQASKASDKALALEAAKLRASRGEHELSAEVQGQANAIRAAEVPSTIAMHEAAAENYRSDADKNRLAASPEMKVKEELKALEDHMHNQITIINSANSTEDEKADAKAELGAYKKRYAELSKIPISAPPASITPESKGYLPFSIPTDVMGLLKKHLPTS